MGSGCTHGKEDVHNPKVDSESSCLLVAEWLLVNPFKEMQAQENRPFYGSVASINFPKFYPISCNVGLSQKIRGRKGKQIQTRVEVIS